MSFGLFLEALVVIDAIVGSVFDLVLKVVLVHHLMKECCCGFLNRTVERGRRDVDFVLAFLPSFPDFRTSDVSIGGRGFLEGYNRFGKFTLKVMLVQLTEHLFQLPGGTAGLNGLFHDFFPLYVKIAKRRDRWYNVLVPLWTSPHTAGKAMGRGACGCSGSWG